MSEYRYFCHEILDILNNDEGFFRLETILFRKHIDRESANAMCTCNHRTAGSVCNPAGKNVSRDYSKPCTTNDVARCQDALKGDDNLLCFKVDDRRFPAELKPDSDHCKIGPRNNPALMLG